VRAIFTAPIRLYQRLRPETVVPRCKYHPTCSEYAVESIRTYGVLRGLVLAAWRIVRCNPWSHGGYDPVEAQTIFRTRKHTGTAHS